MGATAHQGRRTVRSMSEIGGKGGLFATARSSLADARDRRRFELRRLAPPLGRRLVEPWGFEHRSHFNQIKTSEEARSSEVFTWRRGREGLFAPRAHPSGRPAGVIPVSSLLQPTHPDPLEFMSRLAEREGFEPSKGF